MRRLLWQLHSWFGLIAGVGLLTIGLTGSLLVFHDDLEAWLHPVERRVEPLPAGRLPLDVLLADARRQLSGGEIMGWLVQPARSADADVLYLATEGKAGFGVATLNPYTGRVLAQPVAEKSTLSGWLLELHTAFFAGTPGLFVAGLFATMLCVLGLSGVWLYREFWRHLLTLRWRRGARVLFSDLHKFTGITSVAFNLLLGFTGAYWNLTQVWRTVHAPAPALAAVARGTAATLSLDALCTDAARRLPGFHVGYLSLPVNPTATNVVLWGAVEPRPVLRSAYGSTVAYDAKTGAHQATTDIREAGVWTQAVDAFGPLHFGTFGGLPVKILWALGGLTPGVLAVTGIAITLRRRRSRSVRVSG